MQPLENFSEIRKGIKNEWSGVGWGREWLSTSGGGKAEMNRMENK